MKLYRYWAAAETTATDSTGKSLKLRKWDGSNDSAAAAKSAAEATVRALAARLATFDVSGKKFYAYATRDLPEELIGEATPEGGVTRNRYGALVLNAQQAVFVDVDLPLGRGFWAKLFGKTEEKFIARLEAWLKTRADKGLAAGARVYRTARGLRYLFTHAPEKVSDETIGWLKELGSDKLYVTLCRAQDCYRARLSPKPWRVKAGRPPVKYPRDTAEQEQQFRTWLSDYETKSAPYAVCKFLGSFGAAPIHRDLARLVRDHDAATRAESDMPLA